MADLQGTNIAAPIVPFTTDDTYPTHDSFYGKGGYREVATIAERNSIPDDRRKQGMLAYVVSTGLTYRLETGTTNLDWLVQTSGTGGGSSTPLYIDDVSSSIVSNGQVSIAASQLYKLATLQVELNGLVLREGLINDYTKLHNGVDGTGIQFNAALPLEIGDTLLLVYEPA